MKNGKPSLVKQDAGIGDVGGDDFNVIGRTVNFDYTYGPFETKGKVAAFLVVLFLLDLPKLYRHSFSQQEMVDYQCGKQAYDNMMTENKNIKAMPAIADGCLILGGFLRMIVWTRYFESCGLEQNSKGMKYAIYFSLLFNNWFLANLQLIPTWVPVGFLFLTWPVVVLINFYVDDPDRRKKKKLPPVKNNYCYMWIATSTMWLVSIILYTAKVATLQKYGDTKYVATAASMVVNGLGILFTFLFESLTVKASSPGHNGPFMFPL